MKKISSVKKLYNKSFNKKKEYQKVIWGSEASMLNRFKLFFKIISDKKFDRWLDIGTGTGAIFKMHDKKRNIIKKRYGLEVNKKLYDYIKKKKFKKNLDLINKDIIKLPILLKFDLISAIGVLQNSGYPYKKVISKIYNLMGKNSHVFLTSKNLLWEKLNKKTIKLSDHEWINPLKLKEYLESRKIKIIKMSGYDPSNNKNVSLKIGSTFYIYAKKK